MKKLLILTIGVILAAYCCGGCANDTDAAIEQATGTAAISIVTTIFPQYDFCREITGNLAGITMLLPPGAESHSYEPTPQDILKIKNCDLFIYVGGESDTWIKDILDSMGDNAPRTLTLTDCVETLAEEVTEGMEAAEEPSHEAETGFDEHVWTSPRNAILITEKITAALIELDSENAATYQSNAEAYIDKLHQLDQQFTEIVDTAARKTFLVGDRFPLLYFAKAYGLEYYAAFSSCSSNSEAGAGTIAFMINKVREQSIPIVFYIEFSNHKIADAIAEDTDAKTMLFHSCHNVSEDQLESGVSYLSLMEQNAAALREALN